MILYQFDTLDEIHLTVRNVYDYLELLSVDRRLLRVIFERETGCSRIDLSGPPHPSTRLLRSFAQDGQCYRRTL